jgi:hypothetical protein
MIITLSGIHGLGKTTFVNNFLNQKPLLKIVDIDLVPERTKDKKIEEQIDRLNYFQKALKNVKNCQLDILIDRSPIDFYVYISWWLGALNKYPRLEKKLKSLIKDYKKTNYKNIIVYDKLEDIWKRVLKRNRDKYSENNLKYFQYCYEMFYNQKGKNFEELTGVKSKFISFKNLSSEINKILD